MAFTGNFMCTSFKKELLEGGHNFTNGGDGFKIALYDSNASFDDTTTDYTARTRLQALVLHLLHMLQAAEPLQMSLRLRLAPPHF